MMHDHPIRAAVFDIDGTLALMDKDKGTYAALPGAVAAIRAFRDSGRKVVAYTNGTFFPPQHYYPLLADAGLHLDPGHILTPAVVAARQLARKGYRRLMVMGAEGTRVPVSEAGITVILPGEAGEVDAVLVGWTKDFGAADLEAVAQAVWAGAPLYATSIAPYFAGAKGRLLGISGAVAAAITNATGVKPVVFGKPETVGLEIAAEIAGVAATDIVVIGDDPKLEIAMARRAGAFAVGVTTGVEDAASFAAAPEALRAHVVLPGLQDLQRQPWFG
jgi:NagD protein